MPLTEEQMEIWRSRIRRSSKSRRADFLVWERIREYYRGRYLPRAPEGHSAVVNWVFAAVRHMRTSIFYQNPRIYFTAQAPHTEPLAPILEGVIHYERKIMDAIVQERAVVEDALKYGTGILKHGYSFEYGDEPAFAVDDIPNDGGGNGKGSHLDFLSMSVAEEDDSLPRGGWTEHNSAIMHGHPWVKRVSPFDFLLDPEAKTLKEARWMAHRFYRPYINCKRDERYDKGAREELTPTGVHPVGDDLEHDDTHQPDEHSEMVTLYEIYDKETQTIMVISPSCKRPLMEKRYPYHYMPDGPYEDLQFFPLDDQFWAFPYPSTFTNQAEVMNLLRTQMMDHFERWGNIKGAYQAGGSITREDMNKWAKAKTAEMVEMQTASGKITDAITVFPYVPIPADSWKLEELFKNDLQELSGVSENALGGGQGIQTATEASYVQANVNLRAEDMRSNLERFLRNTTRRTVQLLKQYWPASRVVPLTGPTGAVWAMMSVTRDMVLAEFDIDIEPGSTQRVDKAVRTRQVIDAMRELPAYEPFLQRHGVTINWPVIVKTYLELTDVFKDSSKVLLQLPPAPPGQGQGQLPPQGGGQTQLMGGGAMPNQGSTPAPETVDPRGQIQTQTNPHQTGRLFSEAALSGAV